jgi:hypothetical protein
MRAFAFPLFTAQIGELIEFRSPDREPLLSARVEKKRDLQEEVPRSLPSRAGPVGG